MNEFRVTDQGELGFLGLAAAPTPVPSPLPEPPRRARPTAADAGAACPPGGPQVPGDDWPVPNDWRRSCRRGLGLRARR